MASEILCSYRFLMEYWQACSSRCQKERKIYGGKTLNTEHCIHYLDFFLCIGKRAAGLSLSKRTPCPTLRILCFLSAEFEVSGVMRGSEPYESASLGVEEGGVWPIHRSSQCAARSESQQEGPL